MKTASSTITKKVTLKKAINTTVINLCVFLSLFIIFGWIFESKKIIYLFTGDATMKFNTALVFLFSGINLLLIDRKEEKYVAIFKTFSFLNIIIGLLTILSYIGFSFFDLDNLFVTDIFSKINPGKMSPATAICAILLGISFLGFKSTNQLLIKIGKKAKLSITILSFLAIISYVLIVPSEHKTLIFKTMAVSTSILFFVISLILMFKRKNSIFNSLFFDKNTGSDIFRSTLPLIILVPIVLANALLSSIHKNWVSVDFGIATFTIIIIPIAIWYLSKVAIKMKFIENKNKELIALDKALPTADISSIINTEGIALFVNDSFSTSYKNNNKEETINNYHPVLNDQLNDKVLVDNIWSTLNSGNVWTGNVKSKNQEGKTYTICTTFAPIKDTTGKIKTFLEINTKIID